MLISLHAIDSTLVAPFLPAQWTQVEGAPFGETDVNSVTHDGSSRFVAVGNSGKIGYSDNSGLSWTQVPSSFLESNIYAVHYANGLYVAGGSAGKLATSTDGENWTQQSSGFGAGAILGITYVNSSGQWVIVGANGKLATSTNGIDWLLRSSSFGISFINKVRSLDNLVVAVGYDGKIATSPDGIVWTQRASSFISSTIYDVTYSFNEESYVAVGDSGKIGFSDDGQTWTQVFPQSSFGASSIRSIFSDADSYVAGGSAGKIGTAINFTSWTLRESNFELETINEIIVVNNSLALAVGGGGKIAYSL